MKMRLIALTVWMAASLWAQCGAGGKLVFNPITGMLDCTGIVGSSGTIPGVFNVETYGAVGDGKRLGSPNPRTVMDWSAAQCVATATSTTFTCAGRNFVPQDQASQICIDGAGTAGAVLCTTIASYTNHNTVTLSNAVVTTVAATTYVRWGQTFSDCSSTSGSATITCSSAHFVAGDAGKKIVLYEIGPANTGYYLPLSTTISTVSSSTQIILGTTASRTMTLIPYILYGTDNTAAIQSAVDAAATNLGGIVQIPAGIFLTHGLGIPCADIGVNYYGTCTRAYNNITVQGMGKGVSVLENWDTAVDNNRVTGFLGVITVGTMSEMPGLGGSAPLGRLKNTLIADLTVNQVKYAANRNNAIYGYATDGLELSDLEISAYGDEGVVTGGGWKSVNTKAHGISFGIAGMGSPGFNSQLSCLNLSGSYTYAHDNIFTSCGVGYEMAGHRNIYAYDKFFVGGPTRFNNQGYGGSLSSSNGLWDITVKGNWIDLAGAPVMSFGNSNGVMNSITIEGNVIRNPGTGFSFAASLETNNVAEGEQPAYAHGVSYVKNNIIEYDAEGTGANVIANAPFVIGSALESLEIIGNQVSYQTEVCSEFAGANPNVVATSSPTFSNRSSFCSNGFVVLPGEGVMLAVTGGIAKWTRSRVYLLGETVIPNLVNRLYYIVTVAGTGGTTEPTWPETGTVSDGGATLAVAGVMPYVRFANNVQTAPPGSKRGVNNSTILLGEGINRQAVQIDNFRTNVLDAAVTIRTSSESRADGPASDTIPVMLPYGDTQRYGAALPTGGVYALNTTWNLETPTTQVGWIVTRAGRAAAAWEAATSYVFGQFVKAISDNGHVFRITSANCTSDAAEPTWDTGSGATTTDNTCTWTESGASVGWSFVGVPSMTFAALSALASPQNDDGTRVYCSDCQVTTVAANVVSNATCKASGGGSMATRIGGAWKCSYTP